MLLVYEASTVFIKKVEDCADLMLALSHIQRFGDQVYESVVVNAFVTFSLNLRKVQNTFKDLVQQRLLSLDIYSFQVME